MAAPSRNTRPWRMLLAAWSMRVHVGLVAAAAAFMGTVVVPVQSGKAADVPEVYVVRNVPVDATDTTEAVARDTALHKGEQDALRTIFQRLTLPSDASRLPTPTAAAVSNALLSFEVVSERSSAVRYIGQLTYRFNPTSVRKMLRDAGVSFSEASSKPVIVVPVLAGSDGPQVWTDNPWRSAWNKVTGAADSTLVPVTLPVGDNRDLSLVGPTAAGGLPVSPEAASELSRRYGGGDVVVASLSPDATDVSVIRISPTDAAPSEPHKVAIPAGDPNGPDLYARAVEAVRRDLDQGWKRSTAVAPAVSGTLQLDVPIASLAEWVALRDRLKRLPAVASVELTYLDQTVAKATMSYRGDVNGLRTVLGQQGLALDEGSPAWTLHKQAAPASGDPAGAGQPPAIPAAPPP